MRITIENLQAKVDHINRMTGMPLESYTKGADGKFTPNAGNYHLDGAYGGYELQRMDLTVGCSGTSDVFRCGHVSKRELAGKLDAFINGLEAAQPVTKTP